MICHLIKKITELGVQKSSAQLISKNSIVYSSRAPIGHINIVNYDFTTNQGCKSVTPILVNLDFMYWILQFRTKDIILRSSGTTFKEISASGFGDTLLPLPPLAEQKRIVAHIERALEQVEVYAESYNKLQELDRAFPDKLKKSILQYAMQGKLVAQDPNDEPVEVLLEMIRAEKQKLYEEGKLKKKDLAEIMVEKGDDNSPYGKIPRNWTLLSVKDIFSITTGLSYKKTDLAIIQRGVRIIRGGNIEPLAYKLLDNDYYIESKYITSESVYLKRNQLVTPVSSSLEHIGKFARIDKNYSDTVAGGFVFQLTPFISSDTLSNYLLLCLSSPLFYKQLQSVTKLSGQALYNIPKTKLNDLRIALAPEQEQERISNKVGQLFQKVNLL
ncbi:restriction endonuclease subunit S [Streptococcus suis]|uniref:restriction endonuclease subunit S n=1 Tax=Streptococcus suis TaxID=1307 RepID=UPI0027956073|nr:restriction endonuclease subunit S [Streptococcus suis]